MDNFATESSERTKTLESVLKTVPKQKDRFKSITVKCKKTLVKQLPEIVLGYINTPKLRCSGRGGCYYSREGLYKSELEADLYEGIVGCAVGMFLNDRQRSLADEECRDASTLIQDLGDGKFKDGSRFLPIVVERNPDFMDKLQLWHDGDNNWILDDDDDRMSWVGLKTLIDLMINANIKEVLLCLPEKYHDDAIGYIEDFIL